MWEKIFDKKNVSTQQYVYVHFLDSENYRNGT